MTWALSTQDVIQHVDLVKDELRAIHLLVRDQLGAARAFPAESEDEAPPVYTVRAKYSLQQTRWMLDRAKTLPDRD